MDETTIQQDTSQTGDTSGGDKGSTSAQTPETFTKEQAEERERKAVSDALSAAGRSAKDLEKREGALKKGAERIAEKDRVRLEAEIEAARDDPDKLTAVQARQRREAREAELEKREQELDTKEAKLGGVIEEADKVKKERNALDIASKHNVDAETLMKFTDGSPEAMEELAKALPRKGEEAPPLKPDSGKTTGGSGGIPTNMEQFKKWIDKIPQEEYEELAPEINKMMKEGRIK